MLYTAAARLWREKSDAGKAEFREIYQRNLAANKAKKRAAGDIITPPSVSCFDLDIRVHCVHVLDSLSFLNIVRYIVNVFTDLLSLLPSIRSLIIY